MCFANSYFVHYLSMSNFSALNSLNCFYVFLLDSAKLRASFLIRYLMHSEADISPRRFSDSWTLIRSKASRVSSSALNIIVLSNVAPPSLCDSSLCDTLYKQIINKSSIIFIFCLLPHPTAQDLKSRVPLKSHDMSVRNTLINDTAVI